MTHACSHTVALANTRLFIYSTKILYLNDFLGIDIPDEKSNEVWFTDNGKPFHTSAEEIKLLLYNVERLVKKQFEAYKTAIKDLLESPGETHDLAQHVSKNASASASAENGVVSSRAQIDAVGMTTEGKASGIKPHSHSTAMQSIGNTSDRMRSMMVSSDASSASGNAHTEAIYGANMSSSGTASGNHTHVSSKAYTTQTQNVSYIEHGKMTIVNESYMNEKEFMQKYCALFETFINNFFATQTKLSKYQVDWLSEYPWPPFEVIKVRDNTIAFVTPIETEKEEHKSKGGSAVYMEKPNVTQQLLQRNYYISDNTRNLLFIKNVRKAMRSKL